MVGEFQRGQLGRGQYVYYHCTGHRGRCPERYTREELVVEQFTEQLRRLPFDPSVLDWITSALRQSHQDERRVHEQAISRLRAEYLQIPRRLDAMYVDKLDGQITSAYYERRAGPPTAPDSLCRLSRERPCWLARRQSGQTRRVAT